MEEILHQLAKKKQIHKVLYIRGGAGFLPSTVLLIQKRLSSPKASGIISEQSTKMPSVNVVSYYIVQDAYLLVYKKAS